MIMKAQPQTHPKQHTTFCMLQLIIYLVFLIFKTLKYLKTMLMLVLFKIKG
jgi:hypothetical protein